MIRALLLLLPPLLLRHNSEARTTAGVDGSGVVARELARTRVFRHGADCTAPNPGPNCSFAAQSDCYGDGLPNSPPISNVSAAGCCSACQQAAGCKVAVWEPDSQSCLLKRACSRPQTYRNRVLCTPPPTVGNDGDCIPHALNPWNTTASDHGYYWNAGQSSVVLSSNDTVVAFMVAAKDSSAWHTQADLVVRRSFTQGRTWEPFQLLFSPTAHWNRTKKCPPHQNGGTTAGCGAYPAQLGTVLDKQTGTIWGIMAANNSYLLATSSTDHGASWSTKDITSVTKPPAVGWIGPGFSGAQLASGRLSVCIDYIDGQWASYPINHSRSTTVYSDDHGGSWHWSAGASPDGDRMNECSVADLPNNTLVMTARNYLGQLQHTVHRAIMWSDTQGDNWTAPYFCPDLPSPVENGDIILGPSTPKSLGIGQPLFLSHPHSEYDRANGTLLMSTDGGARWKQLIRYQPGCHASSGVVQFKDGRLGVLFDDGGPFPKDYNPVKGDCKDKVQQEVGMNETFVLIELSSK